MEELFEFLRESFGDPGRLIVRLWFLWWLWSIVRDGLRKLSGKSPAPEAQAPEQPELERAPPPRREPARPLQSAAPRETERTQRMDRGAQARDVERSARPIERTARPVERTARPIERTARPAERTRRPAEPAPVREPSPYERALSRAHALRLRLLSDRSLRKFEETLASDVIAPLHAALEQSRREHRVREVERRAADALLTLEIFERVLVERSVAPEARALSRMDEIARACHAPLARHAAAEGLPLRGRTPVAVHFALQPSAETRPSDELLLLPVPLGFGARFSDYEAALSELGRRWYFAFDGLAEQLEGELGLARQMRVPDVRRGYDEASVYACFGPWLPQLFGDAALTLRFGASYVSSLRRRAIADRHPTTARVQRALIAPEPPPLVRFHAALATLAACGRHAEVERQERELEAARPDLSQSHLPLSDGRYLALPTEYLLAITKHVVSTLHELRLAALDDVSLTQVPGLEQSPSEAREQEQLREALVQGRMPERVNAARLFAACLLAREAGQPEERLLTVLQAVLSPPERETPESDAAQPAFGRQLREAFRQPRTLAGAIVLGAALGASSTSRSRFGLR